jgi:hypothetical protein
LNISNFKINEMAVCIIPSSEAGDTPFKKNVALVLELRSEKFKVLGTGNG